MTKRKKPSAVWRAVFLRALGVGGNVRAAALEAGVDPGTAYDHRIKDARFLAQWNRAKEKAATVRAKSPLHRRSGGPPPRAGEELIARRSKRHGMQMVSAAQGRWSREVEETFFLALGRTACVRQSAAAAGLSTTALYKRREHYPGFAAKWRGVEEEAKQRIPGLLTAAAIASFDPDAAQAKSKRLPEINVDQAIRISQMTSRKAEPGTAGDKPDWWEDSVVACKHCGRRLPRVASNAEVREALEKAVKLFHERTVEEMRAQGWSEHEGHMIPPGWSRAHESGTFMGVEEEGEA